MVKTLSTWTGITGLVALVLFLFWSLSNETKLHISGVDNVEPYIGEAKELTSSIWGNATDKDNKIPPVIPLMIVLIIMMVAFGSAASLAIAARNEAENTFVAENYKSMDVAMGLLLTVVFGKFVLYIMRISKKWSMDSLQTWRKIGLWAACILTFVAVVFAFMQTTQKDEDYRANDGFDKRHSAPLVLPTATSWK